MPPRIPFSSSIQSSIPSTTDLCSLCLRRDFSCSQISQTRLRRQMFAWLDSVGENFKYPTPGSTNYLSAYNQAGKLKRDAGTSATADDLRPFPMNRNFYSEPILSDKLRREIWKRVQVDKKSVRTVSVELGVEMRRVGAVVRLMELERKMRAEGQSLATPYARAIHDMVPTTPYADGNIVPHEPINDLPVHSLTDPQLFYPTSESRPFNRTDAGRAFSAAPRLSDSKDATLEGTDSVDAWKDTQPEKVGKGEAEHDILKPADARIPHPHLVAYAKDRLNLETAGDEDAIRSRYAQRLDSDATARAEARNRKIERDEAKKTRVDTSRWQFVVTDVKVSRASTGKDGKGASAVGYRYGLPFEDRKKGQIKIPTKVQV